MTSIETRITSVTVFTDRARVVRQGSTKVEPGRQSMRLGVLPLACDPESVRVRAHGTAHATLLGVDIARQTYIETPAEDVRELEREIELLAARIADVDGQVTLCSEERTALAALLQNTEPLARGIAFGKLAPDAHMNLVSRVRQRCAELDGETRDLVATRRELDRAIQKPRIEIKRLQSATGVERYVTSIDLEVVHGGDLTVELSSLVKGASWSPVYDLRVSEGGEPGLSVGYIGQVTQETGESWDDVELVLSTARPARAAALPELKPWYLSPIRPRAEEAERYDKARPAAFSAPGIVTSAEVEEGAVADDRIAENAVASVESTGAFISYRVAGTVSVPSDGSPHKATVARFDLSPRIDYLATPKLVEDVFRRARVTNESPYVFLAGPANLFSGDDFIGRTALKHVSPGGDMELFLGVCDAIKVRRELKKRDVDRKIIGNRRTVTLGYEIRIENSLASEVSLVLRDQLPVPRDEEIKAKLENADPKPTMTDDLGIMTWELAIPGGSTRVVTLEFSVDHPRQMEIPGLP
ncbi:mucoidy inhibitor MuiA family protein [Candidatus Fermentibacteria bacterium]|nr:mucoidy inhibitor MuiA family protein [Candidatus Fermentibacteria bacterium]